MNWSKKHVIITGGAGFIGRNLIKRLYKEGAKITVVDNFSSAPISNLTEFKNNIKIIKSDVTDSNLSNKLKEDYSYIFHFGSPSSVVLFNEDPWKAFLNTTNGFLSIVMLAIEKKIKKIVFASSASVYGRSTIPQSEIYKVNPINLYGEAKLTCENIGKLFREKIENISLRIFAGYGIGEEHKGKIASPVTQFLNSLLQNKKPQVYGDGNQCRDFVYIDDVIEACIKSAELDHLPPIINVGSGKTYSFDHVIGILNDLLGKKILPKYISKPKNYLEITKAEITIMKRKLSIDPFDLEHGIQKYLEQIK